ncbi:hypothetical protein [Propionispora vibrioides]|uniref:Uncharacterized protein n=1 Tax=Propionispora vibrioides TaxID=112903 RepID=A0A1H8Y3Y8_9FIRM|nr:hypothetical protein [Propionispora vibrioides]SEP46268.1 hypothetical protein SAMN04490178_13816 [Propionispora vibrioides]
MTEINGLKTYTLSPSEIEALLLTDFGGKLQPVDGVKLSRQKQQQAKAAVYKTRFSKPNT